MTTKHFRMYLFDRCYLYHRPLDFAASHSHFATPISDFLLNKELKKYMFLFNMGADQEALLLF